jgi:nucleoside-diphosphate-sugar epimerase
VRCNHGWFWEDLAMSGVLVTGGTGFVGAEIVRMLVARGEGPITVAQRSTDLGRLADLAGEVALAPLDLADAERTSAVVAEVAPERIFHFGAILTGPGENDPQLLLQANVSGFIALIEAARLAGTRQVIFASSIGTYGRDLDPGPIHDRSLQRPASVYGVSKVFGENLGAYYRTRYGLDFRGLRYPSIIGPGVTTWSLAQYTSWMIEKPLLGEQFEVWVRPEATIPLLYFRDAARAAVALSDAPDDRISAINYLVDGAGPTPSAADIADAVRLAVPGAEISFDPAATTSRVLLIDDTEAREEWGWAPQYDLGAMIEDMRAELGGP